MTDYWCTHIPPHRHPPWDVTYSVDNHDEGTGWGAYSYHCLKIPCGSNRRAGEKRKWIKGSVAQAELAGFKHCKRCLKPLSP